MNIVTINNLQKKFGDFTALHDISFEVKKGEVFGYIGPNGAGKSTTIRTLLGILKATSGEVSIFGKDAWIDVLEIHGKIAYVPGDVSLWPNLTGGEVIDLFTSLQGTKESKTRDELVKLFGLDTSKKTRTYSKGNRQKVAIIAALATEADLYIFDEPTSGLDPLMAQTFEKCVLDLKKAGKTIILSSHILSEVEKLCDRVAIIREGKIIDIGTLNELRHLTKTNMSVRTKKPVLEFEKLEYISDFDGTQTEFKFSVSTSKISEVMKELAPFDISYIENSLPTLEDLFLKHYDNSKED